jgi:hypothetical protein
MFRGDGSLGAEAGGVLLRPILRDDAVRVGQFFHDNLNRRISPGQWADAIVPTWQVDAPNHGYMLLENGQVVGGQLAFYSQRETSAGPVRICNVAALCVLPTHRAHSLRLLRAILSQPGYSFTDLSPSGNVRALNLRLGFRQLDTATALVPNAASLLAFPKLRLIEDRDAIARRLEGRDLRIYLDHAGAWAAQHLLLVDGVRHCHIVYRRDRRKNLPLFATILHVSDPDVFRAGWGQVFRHLLVRHGIAFTLIELRLVHDRPRLSLLLRAHRPKMFRSDRLSPEAVDYLYSELTCVAW